MSDAAAGKGARYITLHYFLTNMGLFGLLSTLAVSLTAAGYSAAQTGLLVLVFTIVSKVSQVPLARRLDRIAPATSVLTGCLTAAAGFAGLQFATGLAATAATLALAGLGIAINALGAKQLAAAASDRTGSRARLFSVINVAINVASAIAAPLALFFVNRHQHGYVLTGVALLYAIAGVTTFLNYSRVRLDHLPAREGAPLSGYRTVLRLPGIRAFMLINFLGWLCYGQLFNSLALYVSSTLHQPSRLGWLYTINALLIVVAQLGTTRLAERFSGGRPVAVAVAAYGAFAVAFLSFVVVAGYRGAILAVLVFTVAEMLFVPTMDVLLLGLLGQESRAIGYAAFSIGNALGEAVGGGVGVTVYRWLSDSGHPNVFWLTTAGLAAGSAALTYRLKSRSAGLRSLAPAGTRVGSAG